MKPHVLVVCNALDDATRIERGITSDSPAASRKVFMLCEALRLAGVRPYVLSLGRGKTDGTWRYFPRVVRRVGGIPVVYAPFTHMHLVSEVISLFAFVGTVIRLARHSQKAAVYYNRMIAYLPTLLMSALTGYRNVLDLEDGEMSEKYSGSLKFRLPDLVVWSFDRLCGAGALLACSALEQMTRVRPTRCYYGAVANVAGVARCRKPDLRVLFAGTIGHDTGADLLFEAIRILRETDADWVRQLSIEITGKGESLEALRVLAAEAGTPRVRIHGRLTDTQYREVLMNCDVGLALKPIGGPLSNTTFPSKIVEFAGLGLLVLSTDISDVRHLLGMGARYLVTNDPQSLIRQLKEVCDNREAARVCALEGNRTIVQSCSMPKAGRAVANFIFGQKQ